jgi:GT2 family glycosyltransferase
LVHAGSHDGPLCLLLPDAHIVHLGGQSTAQFRDEMFVALWRSRYLLFDKYYNRSYRFLARQLVRWGLHGPASVCKTASCAGTVNAIEAARNWPPTAPSWRCSRGPGMRAVLARNNADEIADCLESASLGGRDAGHPRYPQRRRHR